MSKSHLALSMIIQCLYYQNTFLRKIKGRNALTGKADDDSWEQADAL